jgi:hypothetical protein
MSIDKVIESKKPEKAGARVLPPQVFPGVGVDALRYFAPSLLALHPLSLLFTAR